MSGAVLIAASSCIVETNPSESVSTQNDFFQFDSEVTEVERIFELVIPPGALDRSYRSEVRLTGGVALDPSTGVDFVLGPPIDKTVKVGEDNTLEGNIFDWKPPEECSGGCTLRVPITIRRIGSGIGADVSWGIGFSMWIDGPPSETAANMAARLLDGNGDEL